MSQRSFQEVPSTPQLRTMLVHQDEGFNQRVPSQELDSQNDDFSLVPRSPTSFLEEQRRTPFSTPSSQRGTPGSDRFHENTFRTPRLTNVSSSSPAVQVVPGTPNYQPPQKHVTLPAIISPLVATALKTRTEPGQLKDSRFSPESTQSVVPFSLFRQPGISPSSSLRQKIAKNETASTLTPKRFDLRKKVLSKNHNRFLPGKLCFDSTSSDGSAEALIPSNHLDAEIDESDETIQLQHNVAHRLNNDRNQNGASKQLTGRKKHGAYHDGHSEDLLDIIDKTN